MKKQWKDTGPHFLSARFWWYPAVHQNRIWIWSTSCHRGIFWYTSRAERRSDWGRKKPQLRENETNDEDQQPSGSETSENPDENSASTPVPMQTASCTKQRTLGFSVQFPFLHRGKMQNSLTDIARMIITWRNPSTSSLLPIRQGWKRSRGYPDTLAERWG